MCVNKEKNQKGWNGYEKNMETNNQYRLCGMCTDEYFFGEWNGLCHTGTGRNTENSD